MSKITFREKYYTFENRIYPLGQNVEYFNQEILKEDLNGWENYKLFNVSKNSIELS